MKELSELQLQKRELRLSKRVDRQNLTTGTPWKKILMFSIPILIGCLFQQLYSMVDAIIVGKYLGSDALAAVGTTGPISFLVIGFAQGITSGMAVITSQKFGDKNNDKVKKSIATSTMLSVGIIIVLTTIAILTARPLLKLMRVPSQLMDMADTYISIIYWGIFSAIFYNLASSQLRAIGDSTTPLFFLIFSSVINVALDIVSIKFMNMGVAGAAWATVVSQLLSSILCYIYSVVRYPVFRLTREDFKTTYKFCMEHLKVGFPMAFQFSITAIGTIIIQASLNDFGADAMSGFTVANKIEGLIVQSFCALGVAMATYCGQNFGAKRYDRIKTGIKSATIIVLICSVFAAVINLTMTNIFVDLFLTDPNPAIIDYARQYLTILAFFYPALALLFVYRNSLQGMGQNLIPFLGGVGELVARSVVAVTLPAVIGYVGVCMASPLAWIAAAIPLTVKVILVVNKLVPRTIKSISINRHTALSAQDKDK